MNRFTSEFAFRSFDFSSASVSDILSHLQEQKHVLKKNK